MIVPVPQKKLLLIEGVDGTGKSTVVMELEKRYSLKRISTPVEPLRSIRGNYDQGGVPPQARLLFYLSANAYSAKVIQDELKKTDVALDRYLLGTIANHNILAASDFSFFFTESEKLRMLAPDVTIVLTATQKVREDRIKQRVENGDGDFEFSIRSKIQEELVRCLNLPIYKTGLREIIDTSNIPIEVVVNKVVEVAKISRSG